MFMASKILKLKGANMNIDLETDSKKIHWKQDKCPWNLKEKTSKHKCAIENVSLCKYFNGIESPDIVLCTFDK